LTTTLSAGARLGPYQIRAPIGAGGPAPRSRTRVMPVIQSLLLLNEVIQLRNFFDALDIVLLSVDPGTGEALRDANGDLIKYNFGNTNWIPLMLRNSSDIIQPEEILADNFATLMEWRADGVLPPENPDGFRANDVDLLIAIEGVLMSGCTGSVGGETAALKPSRAVARTATRSGP
jgi:hypothetical protein